MSDLGLKGRYLELRNRMNYETGHLSMVSRMKRHPVYSEILALGRPAIPIILNEFDRYLQTGEEEAFPGWWALAALRDISGEEPDEEGEPGVLRSQVKCWIQWGEKRGHLAKSRPKHKKTPPVIYKGWVVVGLRHGEESVLCPKRDPKNVFEETHGTAAWVSKIDAARGVDDGWWKKYAWILPTKREAETVLEILNEKIKAGECSEFNRPERAWIEELK